MIVRSTQIQRADVAQVKVATGEFVLVRKEEVHLSDVAALRQHQMSLELTRNQYLSSLQELRIRLQNVDEELASARALLAEEDAKLLQDPITIE